MGPGQPSFVRPPLPPGVDAIRVLEIEPGDFHDPLIGTLRAVTFESKPRYAALSYTWQDSYSDNASLPIGQSEPEIFDAERRLSSILLEGLPAVSMPASRGGSHASLTLNGQPYPIGHNLHLALLHLRSLTLKLPLWIDAICISQEDAEERNAQVALMCFIFRRAAKVVAWLGTKDYGKQRNPFGCMAIDWKAGPAQHFASSLDDAPRMRCSAEPSMAIMIRMAESTYWTRLWIVQEVCLPRHLVIVYGASLWSYSGLRQSKILVAAMAHSLPLNSDPSSKYISGLASMMRLFKTRDNKYTDSLRLESLLEQFGDNKCSDIKDRVYGLAGLAANIRPVASIYGSNLLDTNFSDTEASDFVRGCVSKNSLQIDYSRSLLEIWMDVTLLLYNQTKSSSQQIARLSATSTKQDDQIQMLSRNSISADESGETIVRTAGLVQRAFDQKVDLSTISHDLLSVGTACSYCLAGRC